MNVFCVARDVTDGRQYWTAKDGNLWSFDMVEAAMCGDEDHANVAADDWNSYWQTKGYGLRAFVVRFTAAELEAEGFEL